MNEITEKLKELFSRIPRRHTADNVKEMYSLLDAYEELLQQMEANPQYEKKVAPFLKPLNPFVQRLKNRTITKPPRKQKTLYLMKLPVP